MPVTLCYIIQLSISMQLEFPNEIMESLVWVGKELKDLLVPNPHHGQRHLHTMGRYYNEIILIIAKILIEL